MFGCGTQVSSAKTRQRPTRSSTRRDQSFIVPPPLPPAQRHSQSAKTVKQLLGELYGDWSYLDKLLSEEGKHTVATSTSCSVRRVSTR